MNLSGELSWESSSSSISFFYQMPFGSSFQPVWEEDQLGTSASFASELFDASFGYLKRGFSSDIAHAPGDLLSRDGTAMLYADAQLKLEPAVLGSSFSFTNLSTDPTDLDIYPAFTVYAGISLP